MAGQNIQKFSHAASSPHCSSLHYRPSQDELLFYLLLIIELCTITVVQVDKKMKISLGLVSSSWLQTTITRGMKYVFCAL